MAPDVDASPAHRNEVPLPPGSRTAYALDACSPALAGRVRACLRLPPGGARRAAVGDVMRAARAEGLFASPGPCAAAVWGEARAAGVVAPALETPVPALAGAARARDVGRLRAQRRIRGPGAGDREGGEGGPAGGATLAGGGPWRRYVARCSRYVEAHHHDYARPLDVVWLCRTHHAAVTVLSRLLVRRAAQRRALDRAQPRVDRVGCRWRALAAVLAYGPLRVSDWQRALPALATPPERPYASPLPPPDERARLARLRAAGPFAGPGDDAWWAAQLDTLALLRGRRPDGAPGAFTADGGVRTPSLLEWAGLLGLDERFLAHCAREGALASELRPGLRLRQAEEHLPAEAEWVNRLRETVATPAALQRLLEAVLEVDTLRAPVPGWYAHAHPESAERIRRFEDALFD